MIPYDVIMKKRNGGTLTKEELKSFVNGYVSGDVPDYQMAAFLMAVFFKDMTDEETAELTQVMIESGDVVDLSAIKGIKVDKHSTGGVGDTTTLILAPLVAAAGIPVAKMSGRGLGHTGGTLDKLESIPGLTVSLSAENFIKQVQEIGIAVIGQTADLAPADKKMYALRDVTATIDSIPLIAGSIMSKKIAAGSDAILLDVKVGSGAFMKDLKKAKKLAEVMVSIGQLTKRNTAAMITDMNQPLGSHIGNALEVKEAIEILQGKHKGSALYEVSLTLGAYMLYMGGAAANAEEGRKKIEEILESGKGAEKFKEMIKAQKGDPDVVDDVTLLPGAEFEVEVLSRKTGIVQSFETEKVGQAALVLGAGRKAKGDEIDPGVGLIVKKRIGDSVERGEPIATIFANDREKAKEASEIFSNAMMIGSDQPEETKLIYEIITGDRLVMRL